MRAKDWIGVSEWLKTIVDGARIGIVGFGVPDAARIFEQDPEGQLSERFCSPHFISAFDVRSERDRLEYRAIIKAMEKRISLPEESELYGSDTAIRLHIASGGRVGRLALLLGHAANYATSDGESKITISHLSRAMRFRKGNALAAADNPFDEQYVPDRKPPAGGASEQRTARSTTQKSKRKKSKTP